MSAQFIIRRLIACLLLFAAAMKAYALATIDPEAADLGATNLGIILLIVYESFLAILLLNECYKLTAWSISCATFFVFLLVNIYSVTVGDGRFCNCFGRLNVTPWATLVLDALIILALLRYFPRSATFVEYQSEWNTLLDKQGRSQSIEQTTIGEDVG